RYDDDEDDVETFLLATREEGAYGDLEAYSPNSPLGRALLDAKVGETREYELPNGGTMKVTLLKAEPFRGCISRLPVRASQPDARTGLCGRNFSAIPACRRYSCGKSIPQ